ncbi:hypothetical protein B5P43_27720 [Bacillus sp. SRB_336]|nr:hypothetical protein B5P43_27720 [Bacillus sp. SRB_336]
MARTFTIELVAADPDGRASDLMSVDLGLRADRMKYLKLLDKLTNEFMYQASPMRWPPEPQGSWISFPLGGRVAICLWDTGEPDSWQDGRGFGTLTVMRIVSEELYQAICRQGGLPWQSPRQK